PTKPLALQHRDSFLKHLKLSEEEAAAVTGETRDRERLWRNNGIMAYFATPQTVWNDVRSGLVGLEEYCLLVFDECHRSRSRYAYAQLAS
ncbi:MAG: DEAD/DEAH box helicase, partial [Candidatus Caldarchaeum sp.]